MSERWRTSFERIRINQPTGDTHKFDYESKYNEKGVRYLSRKKNKVNIYDQIQAYRPSCDLKYLLARFNNTQDVSILHQREGFYGDMEIMPKSFTEMLQFVNTAHEEFDKLPSDIKEKFNNNVEQFIAQFGSKDFIDILGLENVTSKEDIVIEKEEKTIE